jgi:hypothetical protein
VDLSRKLRLLGVRVGKLAKAGSEAAYALPQATAHVASEPREQTLDLF